jgi:hypothetical protein
MSLVSLPQPLITRARCVALTSLIALTSLASLSALSGCDTGFGQPCELPKTEALNSACQAPPATEGEEGQADTTVQTYKVTCAVDNYPTCSTMSCLQYRGSSPYCSLRCSSNADCEESGLCCPLFGECGTTANANPEAIMSVEAGLCANGPCYCIRQSDLAR